MPCRRLRMEHLERRVLLTGDIGSAGEIPRFAVQSWHHVVPDLNGAIAVAEGATVRIAAEQEGQLTIRTVTPAGGEFDPRLTLFNTAAGTRVPLMQSDNAGPSDTLFDDSLGSENDAELLLTLQPGEYEVEVDAAWTAMPVRANETYSLSIAWEPLAEQDPECDEEGPGDCAYSVEGQPWSLISDDFNGDGILDIATANKLSNDVTIQIGLGNGTFQTVRHCDPHNDRECVVLSFPVGTSPISIISADFNQDGIVDLATANSSSHDVSLLFGRGDGTFAPEMRIDRHLAGPAFIGPLPRAADDESTSEREPRFLAAADLNQDTHLDLLVIHQGSEDLWVMMGSGDVESPFRGARRYFLGGSPRHIATGDLNGDGQLDVVIPRRSAGDVAVLWNRGDGTLDWSEDGGKVLSPPGQTFPVQEDPFAVTVVDLNGDGVFDLATTSDKQNAVSVLLADPAHAGVHQDGARFRKYVDYAVGPDAEYLISGDFNGDGNIDLLTGNEDSRDLSLLINQGDGSFHEQRRIPVYCVPDELVTGDLNGDGRADLAIISREEKLFILLGLGDGRFERGPQSRVGNFPETVVSADFNGDGFQDLATANGYGASVSLLFGRGDGSFQPETRLTVGDVPHAMLARDLNRDGRIDLVTANAGSNSVSILYGFGDGRFAVPMTLPTGVSPWSIAVGNFDKKGALDLAVANRISNSVTILLAEDDGGYTSAEYVVGEFPSWIVTRDFDGDGWLDLATANRLGNADSRVSILYGRGLRGFTQAEHVRDLPDALQSLAQQAVLGWDREERAGKVQESVYFISRRFTTGDFNNDGRLDLIAANDNANEFSVFLGHGDGTFQPEIRFPTLEDPEFVTTADFNHDGHLDLVLCHDHEEAISIWYGAGNGSFAETTVVKVKKFGKEPEFAAVGDFGSYQDERRDKEPGVGEPDGRLDLAIHVITEDAQSQVLFFLQKEDGSFQEAAELRRNVSLKAQGMVAEDFDADGKLDLAMTNDGAGSISVLLRSATGELQATQEYFLPDKSREHGMPRSLAAGDLNGDGHLDLVVTELYRDGIWVLWGKGDGSFNAPSAIRLPDEANPTTISTTGDFADTPVVLGDFNHDGKLDIVRSNQLLDDVSLLLNQGDGTFADQRLIPVGIRPGALTTGDFNQDGHLDLIVGNRNSHDISMLLGNGDGTFTHTRFAGGQQPPPKIESVDGVDLNQDGLADRVDVDPSRSEVQIEIAIEGQGFLDAGQVAADIQVSPQLVDLNQDGALDLVEISPAGELQLRLWQSEIAPFFAPAMTLGERIRDVAVVSQGDSTLLAAIMQNDQGGWLQTFRYSTSGTVTPLGAPRQAGTLPTRIAAGDLDGDHEDDWVVIDAAVPQLLFFLSSRSQSAVDFAPVVRSLPGNIPTEVQLLDVGSPIGPPDGLADVVITNQGSGDLTVLLNQTNDAFELSETPQMLLRASNGLYAASSCDLTKRAILRSSAQSQGTVSGDFNEDGRTDFVVANFGNNSIGILLSKRNAGYADPIVLPTGSGPTRVRATDWDQDGFLDLAVLYETAGVISIFHGDGTGAFRQTRTVEAGHLPNGFTVDDVNQDDILDLIIGNQRGDIHVLLGTSDGEFEPPTMNSEPNRALAVADVDGDGQDDLILADEQGGRVWIEDLDELAEGQTLEERAADRLFAPGAVEVVDLNGDQILDILVLDRGSNHLHVYQGRGQGEFAEAREFPTGTNPKSLVVGDVNADQRLDVVVANEGSHDLSVLLGESEVLLRPGVRLQVEPGSPDDSQFTPVDVQMGDFNQDGIVDLLVASQQDHRVYLLAGLGHGFFDDRNPIIFDTGEAPGQLLVGQFDDQPGLDLATLNFGSNDVTVYYEFAGHTRRADLQSTGSGSSEAFLPRVAVLSDANAGARQNLFIANRNGSISLLSSGPNGFQSIQTIAEASSVVGAQTVVVSAMELIPSSLTAGDLRFALTAVGDERVFLWSYPLQREKDAFIGASARVAGQARGIDTEVFSEWSIESTDGEQSSSALESFDGDADGARKIDFAEEDSDRPRPNPDRPEPGQPDAPDELPPDFLDGLRDWLFRATEDVLVALNIPLAPSNIHDLLIAASIDLQTWWGGIHPESASMVAQSAMEDAGSQHLPPTNSTLVLWWETYGNAFDDWQPPPSLASAANLIALAWSGLSDTVRGSEPAIHLDAPRPIQIGLSSPTPLPRNESEDETQIVSAITTAPAQVKPDYAGLALFGVIAVTTLTMRSHCYPQSSRRRKGHAANVDDVFSLPSVGRAVIDRPTYVWSSVAHSREFDEGEVMTKHVKDLLPEQWWEVARCVDEYETARKNGSADLRKLAAAVAPAERAAACLELAAVDMEHRYKAGQPVTVEHYLAELDEIASDRQSLEELILEEYQLRRQAGEQPSRNEYRQRFPDCDVDKLLSREPEQTLELDSGTKPMPKPAKMPMPTMIDRYHVCEELGSGTFGYVYRCLDAKLNRDVAVKVPHPETRFTTDQMQGYLHEARGAARLSHPGIVGVLDAGELDDGRGFVVYEYVPGQTLRQRIQQDDYTREEAIQWCVEIADALHYAHTHQVVHRDVTPANILIDSRGQIRLTDFGLARVDDQFYRDDTGRVVGTVAYLAPEQAHGDSQWAGPQTDIYALGVVLYELLAHRRLFPSSRGGMREMLDQIERRTPEPLRTIDETIPKELEAVCLKALAKNPSERFTTAADMAEALRQARSPKATTKTNTFWSRRWLLAAVPLLAVALAPWLLPSVTSDPDVVPPPPPIDEPTFHMWVWSARGNVCVTNPGSEWALPVEDGNGVRLCVELQQEGCVYLLAFYRHRPADIVYPEATDLASPSRQLDFEYPESASGDILEVKSEAGDSSGVEMFLAAVSDRPLSAEELSRLQNLPFEPSHDIEREVLGRGAVLQFPMLMETPVRSYSRISEKEWALGTSFSSGMQELLDSATLRSWRGVVFPHKVTSIHEARQMN